MRRLRRRTQHPFLLKLGPHIVSVDAVWVALVVVLTPFPGVVWTRQVGLHRAVSHSCPVDSQLLQVGSGVPLGNQASAI